MEVDYFRLLDGLYIWPMHGTVCLAGEFCKHEVRLSAPQHKG
jgi:hypothetical protein